MKDLRYLPKHAAGTSWSMVHKRALLRAIPLIDGIRAWCAYASAHQARFGDGIGQDYVFGRQWAAWGAALRRLLDGDLHGADGGTLDTILHDNLKEQGFDPDML